MLKRLLKNSPFVLGRVMVIEDVGQAPLAL